MVVPPPGAACPAFSIEASVSGRKVDPAFLKGRTAVLVFHGIGNTETAKNVSKAVYATGIDPKRHIVVTIVDLRSMAGLWRKIAESQIKITYNKLAENVQPPHDAAEVVLICPDWDGACAKTFGVDAPNESAAVVVLGPDGKVKRSQLGGDLAAATVGT